MTGGAGFIGSHLVTALLDDGLQVTVYDNFSSGSKRSIEEHVGKSGFRIDQADLLDFETLRQAMVGHDLVWHLGANTNIPDGYRKTDMDLKNAVIATCNVLESMRLNGIERILFASTGAVYGSLCYDIYATESHGPLLPLSLYAAGKLSCEAFISAYCSLFDMRGWIFRFGNVVGDRMGHGVIYDFIRKLLSNPTELEILGDGEQEKSYFLVEECVDGMAYAFRNALLNEQRPVDIFNLGNESTTKVTTIAQTVIEEMGLKDVRTRFTGGTQGWPGDQPRVHLSVEKMRQMGWRAKHTSDEAVRIATRRMLAGLRDG